MLRGLRKKASILSLNSETPSNPNYDQVLNQVKDFEIALQAMDCLLDDRAEEGVKLLKDKSHKVAGDNPQAILPLALGVMEFIEATLGFEADVMTRAHETLNEAENASLANQKYNNKHKLATSHIYPPSTEFQVTYAESTLLNALVMLLRENNGVMEQAKALFKLRRAYHSLDAIYKKIKESEPAFRRNIAKFSASTESISTVDLPGFERNTNESEDIKLMKQLEDVYQMRKKRIDGIVPENANMFESQSELSVNKVSGLNSTSNSKQNSVATPTKNGRMNNTNSISNGNNLSSNNDSDEEFSDAKSNNADSISSTASSLQVHSVSTIDEFIHSGVQLCFGILQVVLSLIPPAIGKVLSIVGFRGDREVGLRMLWSTAITSRNIHGELALLCILVFYDGPIQFVDVGYQLPEHEDSKVANVINLEGKTSITEDELTQILKNPSLYTPQLTQRARKHFPNNALWLLQECRQFAAQGEINRALTSMQSFTDDPKTEIRMQQIEALLIFDRAMFYAFCHENDKAARDFRSLIDINSWSKGLYLFLAGCCYHSEMRKLQMEGGSETEIKKYAELAQEFMEMAPTYVPGHAKNKNAKKGGIGGANKQMPFDKFLLRKLDHIEERQKKTGLPFIECIGTSPILELVYFWNGYNRMSDEHLELALKLVGTSGAPGSEYASAKQYGQLEETTDEAMIRYFLTSIILRGQGKVDEGARILDKYVIGKYCEFDPIFKFTKMTYSPYLYPTALYERSMFSWLSHKDSKTFNVKETAHECKEWLQRAETVGAGDYELSNRTGMRIKAATDRVDHLANGSE